ncbi:MAG: hypothetical protein JW795_10325 [Chitinivibrionales bacterium]|nr:hypothetical protein [Chitinivibrionales bacterium]
MAGDSSPCAAQECTYADAGKKTLFEIQRPEQICEHTKENRLFSIGTKEEEEVRKGKSYIQEAWNDLKKGTR